MPKQVKVGYAPGVFDFAHPGHLNFFKKCRELCETFILGVNTDEFTASYKEPPHYPLAERVEALEALGLADEVVVIDWDDHGAIYKMYGVTHLLHGDDWDYEAYCDFIGREALAKHNIQVLLLPHTPGITSTQLRRDVAAKD